MDGTQRLDLLNVFLEVAQASSFSLAGKRLGLPKSTVSRQVARLEQGLNTQLLVRTTHAVRMTPEGIALLERITPPLTELRSALRTVEEKTEGPAGELRVTAATDLAVAWATKVIGDFMVRYPRVRVSLSLTNAYVDMVSEGVDVALRISGKPLRDSSLVARRLAKVHMHLYASPGYLARRGRPQSVEDLATHDWISIPGLDAALDLSVPKSQKPLATNELLICREAIRAGLGVGVLPSYLSAEDLEHGRLARVTDWSDARAHIFLVYPQTRFLPPPVRAFRDFVLAAPSRRSLEWAPGLEPPHPLGS